MAMPESIKCITNILFTRGRSAFQDALKQRAPVTTSTIAFGGHHLRELWVANSLSMGRLSSVLEQPPGVTNQDKHPGDTRQQLSRVRMHSRRRCQAL